MCLQRVSLKILTDYKDILVFVNFKKSKNFLRQNSRKEISVTVSEN